MGQTVNLLAYAFGGSNPSRPTRSQQQKRIRYAAIIKIEIAFVPSTSVIESGSSSFGRAIAFQAIGGEFEPRLPLINKIHFFKKKMDRVG